MAYLSPYTLHGGLLKKTPPFSYRGIFTCSLFIAHISATENPFGTCEWGHCCSRCMDFCKPHSHVQNHHRNATSHSRRDHIWGLQRAPPTSVHAVITTEGGIASFRICVSLYGYCCNYPSIRCPPLPSPHTRFLYITRSPRLYPIRLHMVWIFNTDFYGEIKIHCKSADTTKSTNT